MRYTGIIAKDHPKGGEWQRVWMSEDFDTWDQAADAAIAKRDEFDTYGLRVYVKTETPGQAFSRKMELVIV